MTGVAHTKGDELGALIRGLTKAQRSALINGDLGYCDDNTMDPPGRRMLYRLIDKGLFRHRGGHFIGDRQPDIQLTTLGQAARAAILKAQTGEG